jgi:DNA mismatch repair ATPase MutS
MLIMNESIDPSPLFNWASSSKEFVDLLKVANIVRWLPLITVPSLVLLFTTSVLPWYIPIGLVILQFVLLGWNAGKLGMAFATASKYKEVVRTYFRLISFFEKNSFESAYLNTLKGSLMDKKGLSAGKQINKLINIIDAVDNRANAYFFIINLLTLWDYQFILVLENWKMASGVSLENWFEAIGEVEALSSLALLKHDNPDWATPEFSESGLCYYANELGHPLLPETRISNNLDLRNKSNILLITGSNMSGKSTFLRTAGINLVLAYAGSPVCARSFQCSLMRLQTCMRITDNLEHSTSSFYAELLRIKEIVMTSERGEPLFFLLDEIFKGTNSIDRHAGAEAVINKLSKLTTLGLVSTHDLELGEIERKNPKIRNYHFREFYKDSRIYFDYKLRTGISETRNAAYLMKMAGIDI